MCTVLVRCSDDNSISTLKNIDKKVSTQTYKKKTFTLTSSHAPSFLFILHPL